MSEIKIQQQEIKNSDSLINNVFFVLKCQGKNGNYIYYRGAHSLAALEDFVLSYIESKVHVPILSYLRDLNQPMAYVLGSNRIDMDALTRIAYHLVSPF